MTARTVTGKTVLPSGSAQTSQTVTFVKRSTTISGITVTQARPPITATTNSSGEFSASLDCPADGSTQWTIIYPDGGEFDFTLPYGDGSSVAVTTLISAATVDADAVTLLLDGYEPDFGNPGTSGHVLSSTTAGVRSWVAQPDLTTHEADTTNVHGIANTAVLATTGANTFTAEQTFADQLLTRPVIKDYGETVNAIGSTGGGTQDIDLTLGNVVSATVDTSETTFTFSNPSATGTACSFTLFLTNGGSQTVNWPASVDWAGATAPTLTAAGVDILTFTTIDGGTIWYGFAAGLDMS